MQLPRKLPNTRPVWVFCPPEKGHSERDFAESLYKEVRSRVPVLLLPMDAGDLPFEGAKPGRETLLSPRFPEIASQAIANARGFLSFRLEPALAAHRANVPTLYFPTNESDKEKAFAERLPCFHSLDEVSWEWFAPPASTSPPELALSEKGLCFAAISDRHFVGHLLGWMTNLTAVEAAPPLFHILALDKATITKVKKALPHCQVRFHLLDELWGVEKAVRIRKRSIMSQACSSKAVLLKTALRENPRPIFYSDTDLYFFKSPGSLFTDLKAHSALLFPHYHDQKRNALRYGNFNAGLVGVTPSAIPFLEWWADRCYENCTEHEGRFWDQSYLDLAPRLFKGIGLNTDRSHNVGVWNLEGQNGRPVSSYHATQVDGEGWFEAKAAWDQLMSVLLEGGDFSLEATLQQQARHWPALSQICYWTRYVPYRLHIPPIKLSAHAYAKLMKVVSVIGKGPGRRKFNRDKIASPH